MHVSIRSIALFGAIALSGLVAAQDTGSDSGSDSGSSSGSGNGKKCAAQKYLPYPLSPSFL